MSYSFVSQKKVIHAEIFGTKVFVTIVNENKKMIVTNETILKSSIVDYYSFYTLNLAQLQKLFIELYRNCIMFWYEFILDRLCDFTSHL